MKTSKSKESKFFGLSLFGINIVYVLALCAVIFPLLLVAGYNYPSADDWSYGKDGYQVIAAGGGLFDVLKSAFSTMCRFYMEWEGRYTNSFLASLQPGIWGEEYYVVVPWLMLGGLIVGEIMLVGSWFGKGDKAGKRLVLPIIVPSLMMQILYTPNMVESFYWYTGAVNYTFIFGLSMILVVLFFKLSSEEVLGWRRAVCVILAAVLALMIGGDNYATSLSVCLGMTVMCVLFGIYNRKALLWTWYLPVLTGAGIIACILAPGNASRLNSNFDGGVSQGAIQAIWMSLVRSATNIYSWTNVKIVLMILLILPFVWMAVKQVKYEFRLPGLFTLLTFGLYASQITANLYVDGTTGGGRMAAILYYSYHVWVVGNVCYWTGWIRQKSAKWSEKLKEIRTQICVLGRRFLLPYCAVLGVILVGIIYVSDLKEVSSYKAYRDWRQGWAQQYAAEWDARLEILRDENIREVEFAPLSVCPESFLYTDLQKEDGYIWVNRDCASYFGKESIIVNDID